MGSYYYLENRTLFPFQAQCIRAMAVSPLRKGETVQAKRLASEDASSSDMLMLIHWHGRNGVIPLSQLTPIEADESTTEAIGD